MSKIRPLLLAGIVGALAAAFALFVDLRQVPPLLAGANLSVLAGQAPDPHLLSAWLWQQAINQCREAAPCIFQWNAFAFALAVAATTLLVNRFRGALPALGVGLALAVSPLSIGSLLDPLGTESTVAFVLFLCLTADMSGAWRLPFWLRIVLPAALVFQDPLYAPVALVYTLPAILRSPRHYITILPTLAVLLAASIDIAMRSSDTGAFVFPAIDALAGPPTVILIGILVFLIAPIGLFVFRQGLYARIGFAGGHFSTTLLLCAMAVTAGMFSWTGDPSAYWLAAETALLFALFSNAPVAATPARRILMALLICAIALQFGAVLRFRNSIPSVEIVQQSITLIRSIGQPRGAMPMCLVADTVARSHMLAGNVFLRLHPSGKPPLREVSRLRDCLHVAPNEGYLVTIDQKHVTDWERSGLALASTALTADRAKTALLDFPGEVSPKTFMNLPGHHGAFGNLEPTPAGEIKTMTVVAGFSYRFQCVLAGDGATLRFGAANPIRGGDPVRFTISAQSGATGSRVLFVKNLRAAEVGHRPDWHEYAIPLPASQDCTTLTFAVSAAGGQVTGAWVTFLAPTVDK